MLKINCIYLFLILFNFINLYSSSPKSCAIACIARDIEQLRLEDNNYLLVYENHDNILVFLEKQDHSKKYNHVNFYALAEFRSAIKKYDYILVVKPGFFNENLFKKYDGTFFLCSDVFNMVHVGLDTNLDITVSNSDGNIYFPNLKKVALVDGLEQLHDIIYQTIYDVNSLDQHLLGKGTPNIYLLEVILQTCLFYNRININENSKIFRFPFLSAYC